MDNQSPASRLKTARLAMGMTQKEFGAHIGVTGASVQRWETDNAELAEMACRALEQALAIRSEWLLTGEGPMWIQGRHESSFANGVVFRPLIPGLPTCGPGGEISDPGPNAPRIPFRTEFIQELLGECGGGSPENLFVAEVAGESMRPTVLPGDLALINTALDQRLRPVRNALYLVRPDPLSADARIKRVRLDVNGQLWFLSDAPGFAPVSVEVDGKPLQSLILGRVCWVGRSVVLAERLDRNW